MPKGFSTIQVSDPVREKLDKIKERVIKKEDLSKLSSNDLLERMINFCNDHGMA